MTTQNIQLIVGLGNPGSQYADTRHNAGEWFLDQIASQYHANLSAHKKFKGAVGLVNVHHHECHLLKPLTFMNLSGESVSALANFYKILPQHILVAHDELDLPVGAVRLKQGGGHGGHNGLRSIIQQLGSNDFLRLRIGIGHPGHRDLVSPFVLSKPSSDDRHQIQAAIQSTLPYLPDLLEGKIQMVMHQLHSPSKLE